jgi:hypothetical protein
MKKNEKNNETPPWEESPAVRGNREKTPAAPATPANDADAAILEAAGLTARAAKKNRAKKAATSVADNTEEEGPADKTTRRWNPSLLGYRWVMRNISFFLFLAALAVIYIYNGHYADKISRDINRTNKELKELQYEYKTLKSEVMFRSKQSELAKAVEPFGLKELTRPPYVLTDSAEKQ